MQERVTPSAGDRKLWPRLLLVGLSGALPLFVVALLLIHRTYGSAIEFGVQEQRGIALQRRLERVLAAVGRYSAAQHSPDGTAAATGEVTGARAEMVAAVRALGSDYRGELGRQLGFDANGQQAALLTALEDRSRALEQAPIASTVAFEHGRAVMATVRAMIEHNADRSNLILDTDLDSYYLMDLLMVALPESEGRILELETLLVARAQGKRGDRADRDLFVALTTLHRADLARVQRDAERSLREDAPFNGPSPSLQANLPSVVSAYTGAVERLVSAVTGPEATLVNAAELGAVRAASANLFRVGAAELDGLLATRLSAIRAKRTGAYAAICATLVAAALAMGLIIRSLLAARNAEVQKNEETLRAKEAQLRALGDNLPGGMVYQVMRELDGSMRFLYVSAGVKELHGVAAEAVLADPGKLYDLLLEEDRPALVAAERESLATMTPFKTVARSLRKSDGSVRFMEFCSAPRRLPDGRVIWDGIQLDVTERHRAEDAARQTQLRFSHIFDASPIPIALTGLNDGRYVAANDKFLKFGEFSREEVIGRTALELGVYANPEDRKPLVEKLLGAGHLHGYEVRFRTKSGKIRDVLLWIEIIAIEQEKFVLIMALDVTEQKEATRHERELEEQLRQAQKLDALGTLAGGIAHDFNNILGAIVSFSQLAQLDNPNNPALGENLDQILKASARATVLVRQILSFSRHQKEERKSLQLGPIVREALSLLRATLPSTLLLEQALEEGMPDVHANATQVHQIVMNLCTNAAHAMKGKQGKIRVELVALTLADGATKPHVELRPGRYARLSISDTGHGMDAATRARIFEPFFTTKTAGEGTGLGLSVVHGIVKGYGGVVTVDSEVGRGTTFSIYLPASTGATAEASAGSTALPRGAGQRVLYVDDEVALGTATALMLERMGYRPVAFQSPVAALAALREAPETYAALITDFTMPELTGVDLIRETRKLRRDLPTLLVTGSSGDITKEQLQSLGTRELLNKPLDYATLAIALHRALAQSA